MFDPQDFDATRAVVLARPANVNGHQLERGDAVHVVPDETGEPAELTADKAARLWAGGLLIYADRALATPVETPEQYAARATESEELEDGTFLVRAPWLGEGEIVPADKHEARRQEIIDEGAQAHRELIESYGPTAAMTLISGTDGFELVDNGNGSFEIAGPGMEEPLKIRGRQKAEDKLAELRATAAAESTPPPPPPPPAGTAEVPAAQQSGAAPVTDAAASTDASEQNSGSGPSA